MIPDHYEIRSSLYGAWGLAHLDQRGMDHFTLTVSGFWSSFFAAAIAAPIYIYIRSISPAISMEQRPYELGAAENVLVGGATYLLSWCTLPVLMVFLSRILGVGKHYVGFIVAYNWAGVLQWALFGLVVTIMALTDTEASLHAVINLIAVMLTLFYLWFITRTALHVGPFVAVSIVVIHVLIGLLLNLSAQEIVATKSTNSS
tara:strand:- start:1740 stop:2345 length:606 start_codon:yes stop_codon:yes gene_type:complete